MIARGRGACAIACAVLSCSGRQDTVGLLVQADGSAGSDAFAIGPGSPGDPPYFDFPAEPVLDLAGGPLAAGIAEEFGAPGAADRAGGPCLLEPPVGSLFPRDWLRPRFTFAASAGEKLFELRLHADLEANDLVVYTASTRWTMPREMWAGLSRHLVDQPITMSVRGLDPSSPSPVPTQGSLGTFTIAPAPASGSIVYWTTTNGSALKGFTVGDEAVASVLLPGQASAGTACVGCHASTPDGKYVAYSASREAWDGDPARIELRTVDGTAQAPPFVSPAAKNLLGRVGQQLPAFSKAHWTDGDRIMLSLYRSQIVWTDLEAATEADGVGSGVVARIGDPGIAASHPSFSHDGASIVYTSAPGATVAGHVGRGDIYVVPYEGGQGGVAERVRGASEPDLNEFYPVLSADDRWIAYTRVPNDEMSYSNAKSEIFVVPAGGGAAVRLSANDPPMCAMRTSPGLTNSWPKWSPEVQQIGGKAYYWLIFSSTRRAEENPQLYISALVVQDNRVSTFPALYLWNQPSEEGNHTPAWDVFQIPPASVR